MRRLALPFVVAPPSGARVRTRLRPDVCDEQVLRMAGEHLARLARQDLAVRCRLGDGDDQRAERKRALTAASSSRWAGAITRTSNDQWQRGRRNLLDAHAGLRRAIRRVRSRLTVPVGGRRHGVRGYVSRSERYQKQRRLQHLQARLGQVERRLAAGQVSVCRGGRSLAKLRHAIDREDTTCGLTKAEWRARWQAARWFMTADGEACKRWGNETIRVHPDEGVLEIRLPTPLAHLSNTPGQAPTYRLSCPVGFGYRGDEWAAQATTGAVRYDLWFDPAKGPGRWYLDASWRQQARLAPSLEELRQHSALGVDLNVGHLDCWVLDPAGNPIGEPHTIGLLLDGLPASTRDGRLRAAVAKLIWLATSSGCRSVVVEDLDFTAVRQEGRETMGRGEHGRRFRRAVAGIPTRQFRTLLQGMAANAGLWVVAVDPGWTSRWAKQHWKEPLNEQTKPPITVSDHQAAAVVIGRRGLGHRARRRGGCARRRPEDRRRRAADSAGRSTATTMLVAWRLVVPEPADQEPEGPGGQRAGPQPTRPDCPSGVPSGTRRHTTVRCPPVSADQR
jgi:hypothetical protein